MPRVSPFGRSFASKAVRALLAAEWKTNGGGTVSCLACMPWSWDFNHLHRDGCPVDAALRAAGYCDAESREDARRRMRRAENQAIERRRSAR